MSDVTAAIRSAIEADRAAIEWDLQSSFTLRDNEEWEEVILETSQEIGVGQKFRCYLTEEGRLILDDYFPLPEERLPRS